jgi:hypothetical protein
MRLDDIALFFADCDGDGKFFSQHIQDRLSDLDLNVPLYFSNVANHILSDIEYLYVKSLINILAADDLARRGFFSWSAISGYYSGFFSVQALNRLHLNFITRIPKLMQCKVSSIAKKEIVITKRLTKGENHEVEFELFYENVADTRLTRLSERHWNLGLASSDHGRDNSLRNRINYFISEDYYYDLTLSESEFIRIIKDNSHSPYEFRPKVSKPANYHLYFIQRAVSRLNVLSSILRYVAKENSYYKSHLNQRMRIRRDNAFNRFPDISEWLEDELRECLMQAS